MGGDAGPVTTISSTPVVDRIREVDLLAPLVGDGQVGRGDVPETLHQPWDQLIPADRNEDDVDLEVAGAQPAIEVILERPAQVVGRPALASPVDEVEGLVVDDEDTDPPLRDHLVEVARGGGIQGADEVGRLRRVCGRGSRRPSPGA